MVERIRELCEEQGKTLFSLEKNVELEASANTAPLGESVSQKALEERIAGSVVVDDDDY